MLLIQIPFIIITRVSLLHHNNLNYLLRLLCICYFFILAVNTTQAIDKTNSSYKAALEHTTGPDYDEIKETTEITSEKLLTEMSMELTKSSNNYFTLTEHRPQEGPECTSNVVC